MFPGISAHLLHSLTANLERGVVALESLARSTKQLADTVHEMNEDLKEDR